MNFQGNPLYQATKRLLDCDQLQSKGYCYYHMTSSDVVKYLVKDIEITVLLFRT